MATAPPEKAPKPGLNIYGTAAVNPYKLTIAAEELGIPFNYISLDMVKGELQSEWYRAINPNGKAPAIVHVRDDGTTQTVFESAACLLYMASEFDKEHKFSYPVGTPEYWTQLSWLTWQVASHGPMMGQATHFNRYTYEPVPYGSWRYTAEGRRLNSVLDKQLSTHPYVAGDRLTIADMAVFLYTTSATWCGVDINEYPHVKTWHDKVAQRPGFQKGLQIPTPYPFGNGAVEDPTKLEWFLHIRQAGAQFIKASTESWKGDPVPLASDFANYEKK
ncbi:uncharacterized protein E0L32_001303 [Thyridium curvatum]|uniref:Glutathione S-transferase n=1 Tax=Thyridium curvatum TaxID=1093900 RepID=A0A507ATT2_9PEZI|nr:uncharacterized protein E0L32_001303 [Thyridium curvatum]TPX10106.1 hypothetical protein E0L32_001303 [Thyridium curvatum]